MNTDWHERETAAETKPPVRLAVLPGYVKLIQIPGTAATVEEVIRLGGLELEPGRYDFRVGRDPADLKSVVRPDDTVFVLRRPNGNGLVGIGRFLYGR